MGSQVAGQCSFCCWNSAVCASGMNRPHMLRWLSLSHESKKGKGESGPSGVDFGNQLPPLPPTTYKRKTPQKRVGATNRRQLWKSKNQWDRPMILARVWTLAPPSRVRSNRAQCSQGRLTDCLQVLHPSHPSQMTSGQLLTLFCKMGILIVPRVVVTCSELTHGRPKTVSHS